MRWLPLVLVLAFLLSADTAEASVVARLAGVESPASSPYDFDQVKVNEGCADSAERTTSKAYAGEASLKVHIEGTECSPYARGIFNSNAPNHIEEGDGLWFGAAIFLPSGFFSAHTGYTDLIRIDSYVTDGGELNGEAEQQSINFASFSNDDIYVQAESSEETHTLVGPLSPSVLSEDAWHWVEIHAVLDKESGEARSPNSRSTAKAWAPPPRRTSFPNGRTSIEFATALSQPGAMARET